MAAVYIYFIDAETECIIASGSTPIVIREKERVSVIMYHDAVIN